MKLPITEIFHSLQGEGHFVGYPMAFVRFAGCSVLDCRIRKECDEAPWKVTEHLTIDDILERVKRQSIVCLTGGEPTDHDILPLIAALRSAEHRVHMETSGVRSVDGWPLDWLTVSPKAELRQRSGHTLKLVVRPEWSRDQTKDTIEKLDSGTNFFHRYLQPMTGADGTPANLPEVVALLLDEEINRGARWALSTQAHRFWRLP